MECVGTYNSELLILLVQQVFKIQWKTTFIIFVSKIKYTSYFKFCISYSDILANNKEIRSRFQKIKVIKKEDLTNQTKNCEDGRN